jgi:hypothetical protein
MIAQPTSAISASIRQENPCVSAVFETRVGAAEKTVHHQGFLHFCQILTVKSSVFKADVSQIVSRLAKPTSSGSVSFPEILPHEGRLLAIRESLTALNHVMNPRLLQVKLRLSSGQQTDGLLKVAQLGKAEGNSPPTRRFLDLKQTNRTGIY